MSSIITPVSKVSTQCYHCHEECQSDAIIFDEKNFCCEGCKTVFEILNQNDLCTYYDLDEKAGRTLRNNVNYHGFAFLDDEDIKTKLIDFTDGKTSKTTLYLPQIHCASCIWLLEHLYKIDEGIEYSTVNFLKKEIYIRFSNEKTSLRRIANLLSSIGYAPEINHNDVQKTKDKSYEKRLLYQIGIAGFAFGNIMLLSFPEYLGLDRSEDAWFHSIFGYINIILALPVFFFSATDYMVSAWQGLKQKYLNIDFPLSIGIIALFGRSVYEVFTHTGAGYCDSLAGLVFFLLLGKWFQQKTFYNLSFERDYKSYFPVSATVLMGKTQQIVSLDKLNVGDTLLIRNEELIPADAMLKKGRARIDYSFVSGESVPIVVEKDAKVFAGGKQIGEAIEITLIKKVSQSYLTQLWNDETFQSKQVSFENTLADKAGRYFTFVILGLSALTLIYWLPKDVPTAINAFTAILIVACPCAIALAIPFTLGNVLRIFGRNNFYIKNTTVIENLATIDNIVFDKTGTITQNQENSLIWNGNQLSKEENALIKSLAAQSSHPLSQLIANYFDKETSHEVNDFEEIIGKGTQAFVNRYFVQLGSANFILGEGNQDKKGVFIKINGEVKGFFTFQNQYRKGLANVMATLKKRVSAVVLLSGDNDQEKNNLLPYFDKEINLYFNQTPKDKLDFIKRVKQMPSKVLMLGDGLNDAGALKESNVGIVVTENTNNFTPASDGILHAKSFELLPKILAFSKSGVKIIRYAYFIALMYNVVGLSYAMSGRLEPVVAAILMPLSSLTIVLFGILSTNIVAKRMGFNIQESNDQYHPLN